MTSPSRQPLSTFNGQYQGQETGATPKTRRDDSKSGSPSARKQAEEKFLKKLNRVNNKGEGLLHKAAQKTCRYLTGKLISLGADPDVADYAGYTPLHEAAPHSLGVIRVLVLDGGAEVNTIGGTLDRAESPLHDATRTGNLDVSINYIR